MVFLKTFQSHLVKHSCQKIKRGLEPPWVDRGHHPIICIEKLFLHLQRRMSLLRLLSSVVTFSNRPALRQCCIVVAAVSPSSLLHQLLLVAYHCIHHHIEYGGIQWFYLRHTSLSAEGLSIVPSHPRHHMEYLPIPAEEAEVPGTHAICLQDIQEPGPVQGIVHLVQVQENFMRDLLPHSS